MEATGLPLLTLLVEVVDAGFRAPDIPRGVEIDTRPAAGLLAPPTRDRADAADLTEVAEVADMRRSRSLIGTERPGPVL